VQRTPLGVAGNVFPLGLFLKPPAQPVDIYFSLFTFHSSLNFGVDFWKVISYNE
jgi:hypothetical protein